MQEKIFKLKGKVMHYAWGGDRFIPQWLGINNPDHKPFAEYWMGAHPSASSTIHTHTGPISLQDAIREMPAFILGEKVYESYGELPFLFKILDVRDALSIQVHPSKTAAAKGFDAEDIMGKPINAKDRNYKDRNHKPEIMVALSDFWLLHGFLQQIELQKRLDSIKAFNDLAGIFREKGYKAFYKEVMQMPQEKVDYMLLPLVKSALKRKKTLAKEDPDYWVAKYYLDKIPTHIDRGIFSIYFFNLLHLKKGEGIFQGAGLPHAYLEGKNIELMANSDNVLRAGLTPKHIDVPELLKHVIFKGTDPRILKGIDDGKGNLVYESAVPDFGISALKLKKEECHQYISTSSEIIVVIEGIAELKGSRKLTIKRGEAALICAGENYTIKSKEKLLAFKAFVP